jgi:hypothetical protein
MGDQSHQRPYKLTLFDMPECKNCSHGGREHHWAIQRIRGRCLHKTCDCAGYVPDVPYPKPENRFIGKLLRWRR